MVPNVLRGLGAAHWRSMLRAYGVRGTLQRMADAVVLDWCAGHMPYRAEWLRDAANDAIDA